MSLIIPCAAHRRRSRNENLLVKALSSGFSCSDYTEEEIKLSSILQGTRPKIVSSLRFSSHQVWDLVFTNSLLAKNFTALVGKGLQGESLPSTWNVWCDPMRNWVIWWTQKSVGPEEDPPVSGSYAWTRNLCLFCLWHCTCLTARGKHRD